MLWLLFVVLGGVVVWKLVWPMGVGAKRLECPACDLYIVGARPSEGGSVVCGNCRAVALYTQGALVVPAPDLVAPAPVFCAELPMGPPRWPATCAACNAPATRGVTLHLSFEQDASFARDLATRTATLGMFKAIDRTTVSLDVPHCEQHANGAALVLPYERAQPNFGIAFRSHAYFREFVAQNHVSPRKATMFGGPAEE